MLLEHLGFAVAAADIERAVLRAVREDKLPVDVGGELTTREVGDFISSSL